MSLVRNSFSWSLEIPLCLKQVLVSHIHASHLRVWQTPSKVMLKHMVLIDVSLTVKAATLIFISGRGSAISSAKQGKSGSIYYLVKN